MAKEPEDFTDKGGMEEVSRQVNDFLEYARNLNKEDLIELVRRMMANLDPFTLDAVRLDKKW